MFPIGNESVAQGEKNGGCLRFTGLVKVPIYSCSSSCSETALIAAFPPSS